MKERLHIVWDRNIRQRIRLLLLPLLYRFPDAVLNNVRSDRFLPGSWSYLHKRLICL